MKLLRDAVLLAMATLLLLLAAEAVTRLVSWIRTGETATTDAVKLERELKAAAQLYQRHPFLNVAPKESASVNAFGKQASWNSSGYRSPERSTEKPPNTLRILCVGGSTTFDIEANSNEETWPWRLEERLQSHFQGVQHVEVWNAGFPGWTSAENLISLALRDLDLDPDLVVIYQGINDLQPASYTPFDSQYVRGHADLHASSLGLESDPPSLLDRSLLLQKLRQAISSSTSKSAQGQTELLTEIPPEATRTFARNLRSMVAMSQNHEAQVILATQVLRIRAGRREKDLEFLSGWIPGLIPEEIPSALDVLNQVTRELANSSGASLVDFENLTWEDGDFSDPMHLNRTGTAKLLDQLEKTILGHTWTNTKSTANGLTAQ